MFGCHLGLWGGGGLWGHGLRSSAYKEVSPCSSHDRLRLPARNAAGRFDAGFPGRFSPLAAKEPCPYRHADEFSGTMPDCYFSGLFPAQRMGRRPFKSRAVSQIPRKAGGLFQKFFQPK